MWWYRCEFPDTHTHNTRTRINVCACNTTSPRTDTVYAGRLLAAAAKSRHTLTSLCSSHVSVFIR